MDLVHFMTKTCGWGLKLIDGCTLGRALTVGKDAGRVTGRVDRHDGCSVGWIVLQSEDAAGLGWHNRFRCRYVCCTTGPIVIQCELDAYIRGV